MSDKTSRRALMATIAATSASLAGCVGSLSGASGGGGGSGTEDGATRSTPTPSSGPDSTSTGDATPLTVDPEFSRGTVVEDFENLEGWGTILGELSADPESVYGSRSALVQNTGDSAGVFRVFPEGLDLTENDLTVAFKLDEPTEGKLAVDMYAPGEKNHAIARRYVPKTLDSWVRIDIASTNEPGEPDMSDIRELRFVVHPKDGGDVRFRLDDLRKMPKKANNGKVMLTFDDSFASHYEVAYDEMQGRGWKGVAATIPSEVGDAHAMSIGDLRRMNNDGWDIVSHPQKIDPVTPLPEMSESEQRQVIEDTKNWLELKGFADGAKYFITPYDRMSGTTLSIVQDVHDLGFVYGACNNATVPSGRHFVSRIYATDDSMEGTWRQLKLAQRRDKMTVLAFHDIGPDGSIGVENFKWVLDQIEKFDLDVVTASELAGKY